MAYQLSSKANHKPQTTSLTYAPLAYIWREIEWRCKQSSKHRSLSNELARSECLRKIVQTSLQRLQKTLRRHRAWRWFAEGTRCTARRRKERWLPRAAFLPGTRYAAIPANRLRQEREGKHIPVRKGRPDQTLRPDRKSL